MGRGIQRVWGGGPSSSGTQSSEETLCASDATAGPGPAVNATTRIATPCAPTLHPQSTAGLCSAEGTPRTPNVGWHSARGPVHQLLSIRDALCEGAGGGGRRDSATTAHPVGQPSPSL